MSGAGTIDAAALGARAEAMIMELAAISAESGRLVRLFLSPEHRRAADLVARWMTEAGLAVSEDALGTVRGGLGGGKKRLLIGSHIDTVIDAGKYDGPLGVIAGILAAEHFAARGSLPLGIDVLAFGDEEGSRFPATMTSSSACAGVFERDALTSADRNGTTLADALKTYGKDPGEIGQAAYGRDTVAGYIEVHIEQGPVLEAKDLPLGVVTAIIGQSRLKVTMRGEAGHAGTVPMPMRRDALAGAAEIVLAVERIARSFEGDGMVATVGRIEARPGAVNIIPAEVTFTVDLRTMTDDVRRQAIMLLHTQAQEVAKARGLLVAFEPFHEAPTTRCDARMQDLLEQAIADGGHRSIRLPSGAGHDAQVMSQLCPSAMMFVRCKGGISHNPAEYASPADMGAAVAALIRFVETFYECEGQ